MEDGLFALHCYFCYGRFSVIIRRPKTRKLNPFLRGVAARSIQTYFQAHFKMDCFIQQFLKRKSSQSYLIIQRCLSSHFLSEISRIVILCRSSFGFVHHLSEGGAVPVLVNYWLEVSTFTCVHIPYLRLARR